MNLIRIRFHSDYPIEHYLIDESMQLYDQIKDTVNCPVCLDIPIDPVDCQECSGTICRKCLSVNDADNCVLCKHATSFRPSRNTINFLNLLKFKCRFYEFGCSNESVYSNWHEHIEKCKSKDDLFKIIKDQDIEIKNCKSAYQQNLNKINDERQRLKEENEKLKSDLAQILSENILEQQK